VREREVVTGGPAKVELQRFTPSQRGPDNPHEAILRQAGKLLHLTRLRMVVAQRSGSVLPSGRDFLAELTCGRAGPGKVRCPDQRKHRGAAPI
jgi:hypothetical protein